MEWLKTLLDNVRQGRNAIILTGHIGDGFPGHGNADPDTLVPLHDAVKEALRKERPGCLCWTFDPASGFLATDADQTAIMEALGSDEDKEDAAADDDETDDDVVGDIRRTMAEYTANETVFFARAMTHAHDVFHVLAGSGEAPARPCVMIVHDIDAVWSDRMTDERTMRAFMNLCRMAESDAFRRAGHVLVLTAPSMMALPERFRRADAPFVAIRINRPNHDERLLFLKNLTLTEDVTARAAELRRTKSERRKAVQQRLDADIRRAEEEIVAVQNGINFSDDKEAAKIAAAGKRVDDIRAFLSDDPSHARLPLDADTIRTAKVGDIIEFRDVKDDEFLESVDCKTVLWAENGDLHLTQMNATMPHVLSDGTPVTYCWGPLGFSQRRVHSSSREPSLSVVAMSIPTNTLLFLVPKELHKLKGRLQEANAELVRLKDKRSSFDVERETALEKAREVRVQIANLTAERIATESDAWTDPDIDQQERELFAGRYPKPACDLEDLARNAQGLGYRDLVRMLRAAQADGITADLPMILAERHQVLARSYGHLLDIVRPAYGFEGIAGLDGIKDFLCRVRDDIAKGMVGRVPMGCLLAGPPGTGKTAIAEAFAKECGFLFVKVRNLRSMWVGETERQMEELIAALRELAPVVVLRDEVDQEDTGRDSYQGDSGTSARIRKVWMEFLSDPAIRSRVFVMSCTNRPDLMDAALKRDGRTDERIPVLMPDASTRAKLFPVMLRRMQASLPGTPIDVRAITKDFHRLAEKTDGRSGAEIENIVRRAVNRAVIDDGSIIIDAACLAFAVENHLPADEPLRSAAMTLLAIRACGTKEFLPPNVEEIERACRTTLGIATKEEQVDARLNEYLSSRKPGVTDLS